VAVLACYIEGGLSRIGARLGVGAVVEQEQHHLDMAALCRFV
jgi:hypothetical protein